VRAAGDLRKEVLPAVKSTEWRFRQPTLGDWIAK
jgi:hypothetical protein